MYHGGTGNEGQGTGMVNIITDENFEQEVMSCDTPCIIEFTAGWCTLCDDMAPVFEQLDEELSGEVKFCLVNIDEERKLRIRFAVAAVPYIVLVRDGMQTPLFDMIVSAERLKERIRFVLDGGEAPTTRPLLDIGF